MTPTGLAFITVALLVLAIGATLWRRELVLALPLLAIFNGQPLNFRGSAVRADQLVAIALIIPLAAALLSGTRRLRMDATAWCVVALLVANVGSSVLNSPSRQYSLMQCANLASAWVIYIILVNFLETREDIEAFFTRCVWAALVASGVGIGAFVLAIAGFSLGGAEVSVGAAEHLTQAYGAFGTMVEPNIFGSFTGAFFVLTIAMLATSRRDDATPKMTLIRSTATACAVALVLSFTRSAWIGAMVGLAVVVRLGRNRLRIRPRRLAAPLAVLVALGVVLLLLPGPGALLRFKLLNLVNPGSQTAVVRLLTYSLAIEQTMQHPIAGWGTFTFAPLVAQGGDFAQFDNWRNLWIGNYLLLALHDTGLIGLVLWLTLMCAIVSCGLRAVRILGERDIEAGARAIALTAAVVSLLIPFLATTGFSLGYPWVLIGLLGAHARLAEAESNLPAIVPLEPMEASRPLDAI